MQRVFVESGAVLLVFGAKGGVRGVGTGTDGSCMSLSDAQHFSLSSLYLDRAESARGRYSLSGNTISALCPWRGQSIALASYRCRLEAGAASSVLCRMGLSNGGMGMGGPQRAAAAASAGPTLPRGAFLRARV